MSINTPTSIINPATGAPITVVMSPWRYPDPPIFSGVRDGFACEAWLTSMRRFFTGAQIADASRVITCIPYLGPSGILWWDGQHRPDDTPWPTFEAAFRVEFRPAGFHDHVRSLLFDIKMTSNVADYVARTRRYLAILCSNEVHIEARKMLEDVAKACFLKGAPLQLRQMLMAMEVNQNNASASIEDICQAAERFDNIWHFTVSSTSSRPNPAQSLLTAQAATPEESTAMEIDNLRMEVNSLRQQLRSSKKRLTPLDKKERARLMARGACFKCRQDGHMQSECPERETNVNNLSVAEGSAQPGNASSGQA